MSRILVVDDNENNIYLLRFLLEAGNHVVLEAANGQQAVDMALKDKFDLVLMDVQMPVKDGVTATREILAARPHQKILAVTAKVMASDKEAMSDAGCAGFIEKPIDPENFISLISEYLSAE